jgi:hypothetical protein
MLRKLAAVGNKDGRSDRELPGMAASKPSFLIRLGRPGLPAIIDIRLTVAPCPSKAVIHIPAKYLQKHGLRGDLRQAVRGRQRTLSEQIGANFSEEGVIIRPMRNSQRIAVAETLNWPSYALIASRWGEGRPFIVGTTMHYGERFSRPKGRGIR